MEYQEMKAAWENTAKFEVVLAHVALLDYGQELRVTVVGVRDGEAKLLRSVQHSVQHSSQGPTSEDDRGNWAELVKRAARAYPLAHWTFDGPLGSGEKLKTCVQSSLDEFRAAHRRFHGLDAQAGAVA